MLGFKITGQEIALCVGPQQLCSLEMTVEDKLIMTIRFLNNHYNTSEIVLIYLFSYFVCVLLSGCARGFSVVAKAFLGGQ